MLFAITLIYVALFFVFKAITRHSYRAARRNPEDGQPWQHKTSVLMCWLCLAGAIVSGLWAVVSWVS